jgi:tetratricopeptide (TPR) repeat protein
VPSRPGKRLRIAIGGAALLLLVLACYAPALDGDWVWDDEAHVTREGLRSLDGLRRIWTELGATQQYYPLTHSAFWIESRLFGDSRIGHHLVSVLLHVGSAWLVWAILARLAVPAAWLAAAVFALHPVHVESVAWVSELKNTLSAALYLTAMLVYLRFDASGRPEAPGRGSGGRDRRLYAAALVLFVAALLAKTVTASLPAAILLILWWKRGLLSWRRDVVPLVPFVAIGACAGLFTAWVERTYIGASGADFDLSLLERSLVAGRAFWFYLGKLFLPVDLVFIYPRFRIDSTELLAYLYPAAALLLVAALALATKRIGRGPVAGALFFAGTLFPVLGFFDVYPFKYSFVADHFQYLASLGVIAPAIAAAWLALARVRHPRLVLAAALLVSLGLLTSQRARLFRDALTLWETTTAQNPGSSMAFNNLGIELTKRGRFPEALVRYETAIGLDPRNGQAHFNVGKTLARLGRNAEAIEAYRRAIEVEPRHAMAHNNLGAELGRLGQHALSVTEFRTAIEIEPRLALFHVNLGLALEKVGSTREALAALDAASRLDPGGEAGRRAVLEIRRIAGAAPLSR